MGAGKKVPAGQSSVAKPTLKDSLSFSGYISLFVLTKLGAVKRLPPNKGKGEGRQRGWNSLSGGSPLR